PDAQDAAQTVPAGRREVLFWHFWGGADRAVVERVVDRFNRSQDRHYVRALAMPGNNLDLKLFLAVTGGDPPDLINQDDPIVADWASRGALTPLDELASPDEYQQLDSFLLPAARRLGTHDGRMYALCNGLDIRALYYNRTLLDQYGLQPPRTLDELDWIAERTTQRDASGRPERLGFLPDPRRLWAWGIVFGGSFYDEASGRVTADDPRVVAALRWMTTYRQRLGAETVAAFRQGDQSLPGKTFPLLAGRYTLVMDGQWRVRDIAAAQAAQRERGEPVTEYGVCPLPPPEGGRPQAGWVNGNFFLVPRGARNRPGAWEFMKFWSGLGGHQAAAAETCVEGGWIPVSNQVSQQPAYQRFLDQRPLMREFVELSQSDHQVPTPVIRGAPLLQREINAAAAKAMYVERAAAPDQLLREATQRVQLQLDALDAAAQSSPAAPRK
ncbi:MAG: ABC transporter substrate-binding protein, partial [Pirellulaceae bacterium]|nr:ABC transporter substrate-binding protein [Pirellulaceae bacterium]